MSRLATTLRASGLPVCWAAEFEALRPTASGDRAVRHTALSLARMPAGYRWTVAAALRLFPLAFRLIAHRDPRTADELTISQTMARLRRVPVYAEVLRVTTALALYGALDGTVPAERPAVRVLTGGTR
ncbi:hypothetical protein E6W39_34050 [Kitasatospora acidiphila]|uniref:Uncharacterized protein n=1 Tax=Kitasatospora acidiphila TaxID=2567942 RepID=A0A540WBI8_9ACTN|nr:hypothetical protein [Kitasatospora acidiphila]TQF06318.1 hypothetical protein E6W39_34050 [Kitasatospora acidiphila]